MIKTERLRIRPASDDEMRAMIAGESDTELKAAYREMLDACLAHPEGRLWYTAWLIETHSGQRFGDLCFKGITTDGMIEIGYGLSPRILGAGLHDRSRQSDVEMGVRTIERPDDRSRDGAGQHRLSESP